MKKNTYDASGYRFGFVAIPYANLKNKIDKSLKKTLTTKEIAEIYNNKIMPAATVIDFEDIDGLDFDELLDFGLFNENYLFFVMYNRMTIDEKKSINILNTDILDINQIGDLSIPVDQYVSSYLESRFSDYDEKSQRMVKCFLERYKYGSKEELDKALERDKKIMILKK